MCHSCCAVRTMSKLLRFCDPEASDNDKYVALTFLRNAEVASKGVLPFCQDTGTAIVHGEKGQQVWTGYAMKKHFHWASTKHILKKTCATLRMLR